MGTGTTNQRVKKVKLSRCSICRKIPAPDCDWNQGRCPHIPSTIDQIVIDQFKKFFNFFK
jgi:hypothetical protein